MPHPFRIESSVEIEATPEEVWEAITVGPQLDGWWIGAPNEVEPRLGGEVRQSFGGAVSESTDHGLGPAASVRRRGRAGAGRRRPRDGDHDRGPRRDDDRAVRAQRLPGRRLGGGVRGPDRGRPDVPPSAGRIRPVLPGPAGVDHRALRAGHHRWRSGDVDPARRHRPRRGAPRWATRSVSRRRASHRSRAPWTTCPRPSSACAPTTRSTGSRSSRWAAASTWATTSIGTMSTSRPSDGVGGMAGRGHRGRPGGVRRLTPGSAADGRRTADTKRPRGSPRGRSAFSVMARPAGLEPTTSSSATWCSIH